MERTKDECVEVRRYLAEAFGGLGPIAIPAVSVLTDMLASDDDEQARFEAALALAQIGPDASDAVPVLARAFSDENRYVRDNVVLALKHIDTPEAESALFDYLLMARWCPITNRESTF
jgi:HEAT repeat protein